MAVTLLSVAAFLTGCDSIFGPREPGPIAVHFSPNPETAYPGDRLTLDVRVQNDGLDVHVYRIASRHEILSGDGAGEVGSGDLEIENDFVPKKSTVTVYDEVGEAGEVSQITRIRMVVTVCSDGGIDSDEATLTLRP